jgi:CubicO group peptidase (beta-lactamase class C family)
VNAPGLHFRGAAAASVLALVAALATGLGGCQPEDASRPGSPRTTRTPLDGSPFPYTSPEEVGLSSEAIWLFKERLYSRVVARHVVGSEVLVIVDGRIVLHQAMGWADREEQIPLERNAVFRLASMTKPVVGTAALELVDAGRLDLAAPVARYLPGFADPESRSVTVHQLLTNRSGFAQGEEPPEYDNQASLEEAVRLLGERGPSFPPGESFIYSGLNADILGAVVASISGEPVESVVRDRVLRPLGMADTRTAFSVDAPWAGRVPSLYRSWGGTSWDRWWNPARPHEDGWFNPSSDLYGTAFDYARFLSMWMNEGRYPGGRLLHAGTVRRALADPAPADTLPDRHRWYGMLWEIYASPADSRALPVFGHRGSTGTVGLAIPARRAIVIYLTNSAENEVVDEVIDAALDLFGS